ncbi:HrpJ domain-containing protein [Variovorax saccharolyticus]|uniref:HrpJ domain-containing protein n=1 Tax=Variovorax saccharolyticus TaxID=3053516 RepID=UPI0025782556|nr:HrpJ domain-containing protein [Variovorax sp. J31P216]MDM0030158.1 HrpJ domain-containing protein [Variovorax sp. J31P216]
MRIEGVDGVHPLQALQTQASFAGMRVQLLSAGAINVESSAEERAGFFSDQDEILDATEVVAEETTSVASEEKLQRLWQQFNGATGSGKSMAARATSLLAAMDAGAQPRDAAKKLESDPSLQYLLIAAAWRMSSRLRTRSAAVTESLGEALADLDDTAGVAVRAGLNSVAEADEFSELPHVREKFRQSYRDAISSGASVAVMFRDVLRRFGEERLEKGLALMIRALGRDMSAQRPSTDRRRLSLAMTDLNALQACSSVLRCVQRSSPQLKKVGLEIASPNLATELISLCDGRPVSRHATNRLMQQYGVRSNTQERVFLTQVSTAISLVPEHIFAHAQHRLDSVEALRRALEAATDDPAAP